MAKTYSRSEITPDLLNLNLQYFFNKPAREYKRAMDELVITYPAAEERWIKVVNHWHEFCINPPVIDGKLRAVAESVAATATDNNILQVLDIFNNLTAFMTSALNNMADEQMAEVSSDVFELNGAIYDTEATNVREAELDRLAKEREAEEKAEAEALKTQSAEQVVIEDLQTQIADLSKLFEEMTSKKIDDENTPKMMISELSSVVEAKARLDEAKENANKIADLMENEIKQQRESKELRKHEELISRLDEKEEFEDLWLRYVDKYTTDGQRPTSALFEKFLIDVKNVTPQQIDKMSVSAAIYDDGISNFIDFDNELQRVKKLVIVNEPIIVKKDDEKTISIKKDADGYVIIIDDSDYSDEKS